MHEKFTWLMVLAVITMTFGLRGLIILICTLLALGVSLFTLMMWVASEKEIAWKAEHWEEETRINAGPTHQC